MKILVTGGAGFIGSHYVRTLLQGNYPGFEHAQVTVLDKLTYAGNQANLAPVATSPGFSFVRGDICDAALLTAVVPGHDAVINFAAESHVDRSIAGAAEFVTSNAVGVQVLLQACLDADVPRFVQVSTDEVYGSVDHGSWKEDAPLAPNSPYAAAKAGGDLLARAYARTHGVNVSITRCCNNYGPYQHPEKVIPLFVTNLLDGLKVPLYGDGQNVRGWVHVDDHCRGIQLVLERGEPGGVYHINGDAETDQYRAGPGTARMLRRGLGDGGPCRGPQGARSALLAGRLAAPEHGLRPADTVQPGPGRYRPLVRAEP